MIRGLPPLLVVVAIVLAGCEAAHIASPPTTASATPSTRSVTPSPRPTPSLSVHGALITADASARDRAYYFADAGVLYAVATQEGPAPYDSRVQRFDASRDVWQDVFRDDAMLSVRSDVGHLAILEYRAPPLGAGAFDERLIVYDVQSEALSYVDAFALSSRTYQGGGGGPRRPTPSVVIAGGNLAWTRLNEIAGGVIEGQLQVIVGGHPAVTVARSREWVSAVAIDDLSLLYVVASGAHDELRIVDLRTMADRSLAELVAPDRTMGRGGVARSGDTVAWIDNPPQSAGATARLRTVDIGTRTTTERDLGASYCVGLSGNALGFMWDCPSKARATTVSYYDPRAARDIEIAAFVDRPNAPEAIPGGFLWFDVRDGVRRLNLLTLG